MTQRKKKLLISIDDNIRDVHYSMNMYYYLLFMYIVTHKH